MNNISLDDIALFVRVIDAGGFTACAREVGLPKSSVSRRLAALEKQLGVKLLERTTRRMNLTPEGERFYRYGQPLITDLQQLPGLVQNQETELNGNLRLLLSKEFVPEFLEPVAQEFLKNGSLSLDIDLHAAPSDWPEERFDLALSLTPLDEQSTELRCEPLSQIELGLFAAPGYLEDAAALEHPDQLVNHRVIVLASEPVVQLQRRNRSWRFDSADCRSLVKANDFNFLLEGCRAGLGIALLPKNAVLRSANNLTEVLPGYKIEPRTIFAVYPQRGYIDPRVQTLIDQLREHFQRPTRRAA